MTTPGRASGVHRKADEPRVRRLPGMLPRYEVFCPHFLPDPQDKTHGVFGDVVVVWGKRRADRLAGEYR